MKTVIYLDVLLLVNCLVDDCLLAAVAKITAAQAVFWRLLLGAVVGAAGSLVILLPEWPIPLQMVYQLALCCVMVWVSFGRSESGAFLARALWLLLLTTMLAGLVLLWLLVGQPRGVQTNNLAVYLYVSPLQLAAGAVVVYGLVWLWLAFYGRQMPKPTTRLRIDLGIGLFTVDAMLDTGFSMRDPFAGYPVIMVDYQAVVRQLPEQLVLFLEDWFKGKHLSSANPGIRLLPCQTATGQALLPGVTAKINRKPVFLVFSGQRLQIPRVQAIYGWELGLIG